MTEGVIEVCKYLKKTFKKGQSIVLAGAKLIYQLISYSYDGEQQSISNITLYYPSSSKALFESRGNTNLLSEDNVKSYSYSCP